MKGFMVKCEECNTQVSYKADRCVKCGAPISARDLVEAEVKRIETRLSLIAPEWRRVRDEMNALDHRLRKPQASSTAKLLGFTAKALLPRVIRNSPVGEYIDDMVVNSVLTKEEHKRLGELEKRYLELSSDKTVLEDRLKHCEAWLNC